MKKTILAVTLTLSCGVVGLAQKAETRTGAGGSNETSASARKAGKSIDIKSGTRLAAALQNSIDARKAKVGDQVVFKTSQAIKAEGHTVVEKGMLLIGHLTEVEHKAQGNGESRLGLVFDRLEKGSLEVPVSATITSITNGSAGTRAGANDEDLFAADANARSNTSARSTTTTNSAGSGSGGLLGGVSNTVGGVVNTTAPGARGVVGNTTGGVGATVDSTTKAVGGANAGLGSLGRIQITESGSTSADGSTVLSVRGDNLRLEKGTIFNLMINQAASANASKEP